MTTSLALFPIALLTLGVAACIPAHGVEVRASKVDQADLAQKGIAFSGKLDAALQVVDRDGAHVLLLTSVRGASHEGASDGRVERIDLLVRYFRRGGNGQQGPWMEEWTIKDGVDCPGLDADAAFFTDAVSVTDVNRDGVAEVSVPYKMFCGGGIDAETIKIIMRQGREKYALRGESLVRLPGQAAFGGSYKLDAALALPAHAAYKNQLLTIWLQVYARRTH